MIHEDLKKRTYSQKSGKDSHTSLLKKGIIYIYGLL